MKIIVTIILSIIAVSSIMIIEAKRIPILEERGFKNQKILKDRDGNYYRIEHHLGTTYKIEPIDTIDLGTF